MHHIPRGEVYLREPPCSACGSAFFYKKTQTCRNCNKHWAKQHTIKFREQTKQIDSVYDTLRKHPKFGFGKIADERILMAGVNYTTEPKTISKARIVK